MLFQELPEGEELKDPVAREATASILSKNKETAFLLASWLGKVNVLRTLINEDASLINTKDKCGR